LKKIGLLLLMFLTVNLFAQDQVRSSVVQRNKTQGKYTTASRYIFSTTDDALMMTVNVWGEVKKPGIYEVPLGIDLIELLSSAGGPTDASKLSSIKVIRIKADTLRNSDQFEPSVFTVDVKAFLEHGDISRIPKIQPNDTVVVPVKPTEYVLKSLKWTQQFLSLISIYTMIQFYIKRSN